MEDRARPAAPGAGPPDRGPARRPVRVVGITVVFLLAGVLLGTSAALAQRDPDGDPQDLVGLIQARDAQVRELSARADTLGAEVEQLQGARANSATGRLLARADGLAGGIGMTAVTGPAVRVTLDDAGYTLDTIPEGYTVDDVVVHQQDLQGVINALWAGGAEAVMVQDQRIVATSSVQCVGNTLFLQGRVYSPPYTVTAVGDPAAMLAALEADPVVSVYRDWAGAVGLGYDVEQLDSAELPAFAGSVSHPHARIATSG